MDEQKTPLKTASFGSATYAAHWPNPVQPDSKKLNVVMPFEEATKLLLAWLACVMKLGTYNRATKNGKRMGLYLTIHLDNKRVSVMEHPLPKS
jgi:hypothetical protein